jgi:hypothetical protein
VYVNRVDLEEDYTGATVLLSNLVSVNGKNWTVADSAGADQTAVYNDGSGAVATVTFNGVNRTVALDITCTNFSDTKTQTKCQDKIGAATLSQSSDF